MTYRNVDCPQCGRHRILDSGTCEKCGWNVDGQELTAAQADDMARKVADRIDAMILGDVEPAELGFKEFAEQIGTAIGGIPSWVCGPIGGLMAAHADRAIDEPPRRIEITPGYRLEPSWMGNELRSVSIVGVDLGGDGLTVEQLMVSGHGYLFLIHHVDAARLGKLPEDLRREVLRLLTLNTRWSVTQVIDLVMAGPEEHHATAAVKQDQIEPAIFARLVHSLADARAKVWDAIVTHGDPKSDHRPNGIMDAMAKKLKPPPPAEPHYHWYNRDDRKKNARRGPRGKQNRKGKKR